MTMHKTTGRRSLGLALAALTALLWGILPIVLKLVLQDMDPLTVTWYRFTIASVIMVLPVLRKNGMPSAQKLSGPVLGLMFITVVGLSGNYAFYLLGLNNLMPSTAAVVIQLAPMFLLIGSLIVFKERFSPRQFAGFAVLLLGLTLFFNQRLGQLLFSLGQYTKGVLLIVAAALVWAAYALAQKQLLRTFPSQTIMLVIYICAGLIFLPLANAAQITELSSIQLVLLLFCGINTVVAYGCFSEALNHLEASRVSAVITTVPLITIVGMKVMAVIFPGLMRPEGLNALSVAGAVLVVGGSMVCSLSQSPQASAKT